jgi:formate C-acetyltransferase
LIKEMNYNHLFSNPPKLVSEARLLHKYGLHSAALFFINKNEPIIRRISRVTRLYLEQTPLPEYLDSILYPYGGWSPTLPNDDREGHGFRIGWRGGFLYDKEKFHKLIQSLDQFEKDVLQRIPWDIQCYSMDPGASRYIHGGGHWVTNHRRVLKEGLSGYRNRIIKQYARAPQFKKAFFEGMLDIVDGTILFVSRCIDKLKSIQKNESSNKLYLLIKALEKVPVLPAETFYEALVCTQFLTYMSSEPGRLDQYLYPYFKKDLQKNQITIKKVELLLEELITNVDKLVGSPGAWHMTLGGTDENGQPTYNDLTNIILKIMRRHRQPNTSLRVRHDMPEDLWEIVLDNYKAGCGNPALINERIYLKGLKEISNVSIKDLPDYAFGGCTETLIEGKSLVDSIGALLNLPDILEQSIISHLLETKNFNEFLDAFKTDIKKVIIEMVNQINLRQHHWGVYWTDPIRTLLTDDCIEKSLGIFEGGARYNFMIVNVQGTSNIINSLFTIKKMYDKKLKISKESLLNILSINYEGHILEHAKIKNLTKFGNCSQEIDLIAKDIVGYIFNEIKDYKCWRGNGSILPAVIGWTDFVSAGRYVGATPDGRKQGEAFADSIGPVQGTDKEGPTSVLLSTANIPQKNAIGTCVLNLMFNRECFETDINRAKIRAALETYFNLGGNQIQINVLDRKTLEKAMKNPERYENLLVRVAGYNDYFVRQTDKIKQEIIKRTLHNV